MDGRTKHGEWASVSGETVKRRREGENNEERLWDVGYEQGKTEK